MAKANRMKVTPKSTHVAAIKKGFLGAYAHPGMPKPKPMKSHQNVTLAIQKQNY